MPRPPPPDRPSAETHRLAFEESPEGMLVADAENRVTAANPAAARLLGLAPEDLRERGVCDFLGGAEPCRECFFRRVILQGETVRDLEQTVALAGGGRRQLFVSASPIAAGEGRARGAVYLLRDAAGVKVIDQRLREEAATDPLTGLANRRALDRALAVEIARARRHARGLALLLIDVDEFKKYNDAHGHPAGDELLKTLAKILTVDSRPEDLAARWGGEEFVLLLPEADAAAARAKAERLREEVASWPFPGGPVTVSVGLSALSRHDRHSGSAELLKTADEALYAAKRAGRNRVAEFSPAAGLRPAHPPA